MTLKNTIENFQAGSISSHFSEWTKITSDQWLLDIVKNGYAIEFESDPMFSNSFHQASFSSSPAQNQLDLELWYKVFFFTDSCRLDIAIKDSG